MVSPSKRKNKVPLEPVKRVRRPPRKTAAAAPKSPKVPRLDKEAQVDIAFDYIFLCIVLAVTLFGITVWELLQLKWMTYVAPTKANKEKILNGMTVTYKDRRLWIASETPSVTEICNKFKHFTSYEGDVVRRFL